MVPSQTRSDILGKKSILAPVIGGVVGGLALAALTVLAILLGCRRRHRKYQLPVDENTITVYRLYQAGRPSLRLPSGPDGSGSRETPATNVIPSKARQSAQTPSDRHPPTASTPSASALSGSGSRNARSVAGRDPHNTHASQVSVTEVQELRAEMENLRRVLENRHVTVDRVDAPPSYAA